MQLHRQFRIALWLTSRSTFFVLTVQLWSLAVTVLRTGCILTTGHPLQVNGGKHIEFRHFTEPSFTDVNALISA